MQCAASCRRTAMTGRAEERKTTAEAEGARGREYVQIRADKPVGRGKVENCPRIAAAPAHRAHGRGNVKGTDWRRACVRPRVGRGSPRDEGGDDDTDADKVLKPRPRRRFRVRHHLYEWSMELSWDRAKER